MGKRSTRIAPHDGDGSREDQRGTPSSLARSISPPSRSKKRRLLPPPSSQTADPPPDDEETSSEAEQEEDKPSKEQGKPTPQQIFKSPFQLTKIRDLPAESNIDAVTLKDILGDPLIAECWEFNYLHNIDFLMGHFDSDVRHLVKVHLVHGFWKREDANRLALQEQASRYSNVVVHAAFMPEMFGTHHSKMMILLRHDDTAQIIIHTANMIIRDWTNMTQAVWRSPLLPRLSSAANTKSGDDFKIGSGEKFKVDFLNYLYSYDTRRVTCGPIAEELRKYDFSAIRGSLIASVPGRHDIRDGDMPTRWGWAAVKQALKAVPIHTDQKPEIAIQISSIATLGPTDTWLKNTLFSTFSGGLRRPPSGGPSSSLALAPNPDFKVIFPTPDEIRVSLDGYQSGGSIHTKIQSPQQKKQLQYLKPMFCHWANDTSGGAKLPNYGGVDKEAGRKHAAPHIKTYIRYYGNNDKKLIDWALLTSANLSKQAWGEAPSSTSSGEIVRISSYEIGVLMWPELLAGEETSAVMCPTFMKDTPEPTPDGQSSPIVGLRMPYNLPLQRYGKDEVPWVATADYDEPDWMGQMWTSWD
ncbi:tyrosyl-DNA phosphodiesterase I [Apodospora peruviana]|uniref:Tyrosyl-DNA phosphodiesterase I n=1 Tax=Apodospora peruviana TaxID=516989 RepID=A0AAE0I6M1_9PEZI|nr:tyrosyl-DNA phosphodiesterase I [Apodospora peruviana]